MAFLVTLCENLLEENPFSEMVKSDKAKGNAFNELTKVVLTFKWSVGVRRKNPPSNGRLVLKQVTTALLKVLW